MTRAARRRGRQQMPQTAHTVPDPARGSLVDRANALAREARAQGFSCVVDLGDSRHPYKPEITIEIWVKGSGSIKDQ